MKNSFDTSSIGSVREDGFLHVFERICYRYRWVFAAVLFVVAIAVPQMGLSRATLRLLTMIGLYSMLGMGLNVLLGYTGQVSLGHAGFYGIGAYTCALLQVRLGWDFWPALLAAGVLTGLVGLLLGLPTLRLSGTYLSIVTLGFCEIVQMVLKQWESVTYGNYGVRNIPKPELFGYTFNLPKGGFYMIILVLAVLTAVGCRALINSKTGRALTAIREDELAATMMGIKTSRYKILAFVISAFITGVAGGFYCVINNGYIEPTNFVFNISVLILSVVIVGGMGTIRGMVFGAALLMLFPEVFRGLNEWRFVIYGVLLVLMMLFRPQGALGWQSTLPFHLSGRAERALQERGYPGVGDGPILARRQASWGLFTLAAIGVVIFAAGMLASEGSKDLLEWFQAIRFWALGVAVVSAGLALALRMKSPAPAGKGA